MKKILTPSQLSLFKSWHYNTIHAVRIKDLYFNFDYKHKTNIKYCYEKTGYSSQKSLFRAIFRCFFQLMILDIIKNNVNFVFSSGRQDGSFYMKEYKGDQFIKLYGQTSKFKNINYNLTDYTGYLPHFRFKTYYKYIEKPIYFTSAMTDMITERVNNGEKYF